jgi:hypothetical protein
LNAIRKEPEELIKAKQESVVTQQHLLFFASQQRSSYQLDLVALAFGSGSPLPNPNQRHMINKREKQKKTNQELEKELPGEW